MYEERKRNERNEGKIKKDKNMKETKNYFRNKLNEKKALKEYMENYSTPKELAEKYNIDPNILRKIIQVKLDEERHKNQEKLYFNDEL